MLWSMKKGRPLGALRTSQPGGIRPNSCLGWGLGERWGLGECCGEASGDSIGGWYTVGLTDRVLWPPAPSEVIYTTEGQELREKEVKKERASDIGE